MVPLVDIQEADHGLPGIHVVILVHDRGHFHPVGVVLEAAAVVLVDTAAVEEEEEEQVLLADDLTGLPADPQCPTDEGMSVVEMLRICPTALVFLD